MIDAENAGKYNVAFQAAYQIAEVDKCIEILVKSKRFAEAAFFARAHAPSKLGELIKLWEG